jgi:hypothetical protein
MVTSAIEVLAVAKAVGKNELEAARDALGPGTYDIDLCVRVHGAFQIGEPYEQRIVAKADPWKILGAAMSRLNGTTVAALVRDSETVDAEPVKRAAQEAIEELKAATTTVCRGRVTSALAWYAFEIAGERAADSA